MHNHLHPAQLWLGSHEQLALETLSYLQQQFCMQNGCGLCTPCTQVYDKQHHGLLWLEPEKNYTLESLEPIKTACAYTLEANEHFYFVLNKAELLSVVCQNSLLKIIEEPPTGYHFILLATHKDAILPTIQSRCILKYVSSTGDTSTHPLVTFFKASIKQDPSILLKLLEEHKPSEQESNALVNQLLNFWLKEFKHTASLQESPRYNQAQRFIMILNECLLNPPMPGGTALFWKNVYLQFYTS
ncbi:MAG: hypothetical protein AB7F19_01580 [Candidatus Babeliales bacterium]